MPASSANRLSAVVEPASSPAVGERPAATAASETERKVTDFATASVAHKAVSAVMEVVDAQVASRLQPAPRVNLRLNVGGEDLAIKVEVRGTEVSTQFATDSAELRSALTNEWHAVAAESPERALRFLEPVFSSSGRGSDGQSSFASQQQAQGDASSQQQQARQPRAAEFFGGLGRSYAAAESEPAAAARTAPVALPTSLHLSAVA